MLLKTPSGTNSRGLRPGCRGSHGKVYFFAIFVCSKHCCLKHLLLALSPCKTTLITDGEQGDTAEMKDLNYLLEHFLVLT